MLVATFIALLSAFASAMYFVAISGIMKRSPEISSGLALAVGHLAAALLVFPLVYTSSVPWQLQLQLLGENYFPLIVSGVLLVISRQLHYYAYARTDVANITIFSALTPVYALVTGFFMLGEVPTAFSLFGMSLICGSIYWLFLKRDNSLTTLQNLFQPILAIGKSKPVLFAFLSTIPTALVATFQKQLLFVMTPVVFTFWILLITGLFALVFHILVTPQAQMASQMRLLPLKFIVISAIFLPLTHWLFCLVMQEHQTAISLVLQRTSIIFQILLAYGMLSERDQIKRRIFVALFVMVGFAMIMVDGHSQ